MSSPKQFANPTKIHFVSPAGTDVGTVFVDRVAPHPGGASFYLGKMCVAILNESYLMIGPRQIDRSALKRAEPFWYDPNESSDETSAGPFFKTVHITKA